MFSQRIVAWHALTSKATDLVMIPLRMALWERNREGNHTVPGELIHHSDAGSQYTSLRLTEHLALEEIRPSIGSVGDAYDTQSPWSCGWQVATPNSSHDWRLGLPA